jgi:PAS domain S-box-containing protein
MGTFRDITERMRTEETQRENEAKFKSLANNGMALIWMAGLDKLCFYFNEPWLNFTGRTLEQEHGNGWAEGVHPDDFDECFRIYVSAFDKQEKFDMDYRLRHNSGEYRWIKDMGTPNYNSKGEFIGYIGHCFDITEQKRADAVIQRKNIELGEINASKDKFFSIIAHDLLSPLNGFLGLTKLMADDTHSFTMRELQEISSNMQSSASNLNDLLRNLLEWARMQRGVTEFNLESIMISFVIKQNIEILSEFARQKNIELIQNIDDSVIVHADIPMLNTVLRNLISNAIKFTNQGGKVEIGIIESSDDLKLSKDYTEIYVRDNGIGMNEKILDNLFKLDQNVSRPGTKGELSTGLGLLLCKEFVEKHGGKIWAESEEGKGSTFHFTLLNIK